MRDASVHHHHGNAAASTRPRPGWPQLEVLEDHELRADAVERAARKRREVEGRSTERDVRKELTRHGPSGFGPGGQVKRQIGSTRRDGFDERRDRADISRRGRVEPNGSHSTAGEG